MEEGNQESVMETTANVQVEGEVIQRECITTTNASAGVEFTALSTRPTLAFQSMTKEELETAAPTPPKPEPAKRTKVAILGFTDSWKLAPFDDPEYEIWGLNELYQFIPRWDRWFELHSRRVYENDRNRVSDHINKLKAMTCPIYMHQHWDDIPTSVGYPLQDVARLIPNPSPGAKPYLTNSISYMTALAIIEGHFTDIGVFGVDMAHCLTPDMRVLTADLQWVPAGDLRLGQELLAFDEEPPVDRTDNNPAEFRKYRKAKVTAMNEIVKPCYRLTMADGTELTASTEHKWLTLGGIKNQRRWMETDKLQAQSVYPNHASKIVKLMDTWNEDHSWEAGYLAAAFDGEGHISQGERNNCNTAQFSIGFAQRPNAMLNEVDIALAKLGFRVSKHCSDDGCQKYAISGGRPEHLRFLGQIRPRRLLAKFDSDKVGCLNSQDNVPVERSEYIGERTVIGLATTTRTLIVEGYASHNSTEYGQQRPSCEFYLGIAMGRGIRVYVPPQADLLKTTFLYGFEEEAANAFDTKLKARKTEIEQKIANLDNQISQLTEARAQYRGAHQDTDYMLSNWRSNHA